MDANTLAILQPKMVLWNTMQISLPKYLIRQLRRNQSTKKTFTDLFRPKFINKIASIKLHGQPGRTEPEILDQGNTLNNVLPTNANMKEWGTIDIVVPEEMIHRNQNGRISIKKTLTNVRNYPKRIGRVPSIKFKDDGLQIIDKGDLYNMSNIDVLQNQDIRQTEIAAKINALAKKFNDHVLATRGRNYEPGRVGRVDYFPDINVSTIAFIYLIRKHNHNCLVGFNKNIHGIHQLGHSAIGVGIGIDMVMMEDQETTYSVPESMKITAEQIGPQLRECKRKKMKTIVIPLLVRGHYNILVYRPILKTVERFEPHGQKFTGDLFGQMDNDWNDFLKTLFEESLTRYLGALRYVPPSEVCPDIDGFQNMESVIDQLGVLDTVDEDGEGGGFCVVWGLLMADLVMSRPDIPTKTLIRDVMKAVDNNSVAYAKVIRGFVLELEEECDRLFKEMVDRDFQGQMVRWTQGGNVNLNFMIIMLRKIFTQIGKKNMKGFEIDLYKAGYGLPSEGRQRFPNLWHPLQNDPSHPDNVVVVGSDSDSDSDSVMEQALGRPIFDFVRSRSKM